MLDRENNLLVKFKEFFRTDTGVGITRAPGRVNIIGEHTDYNDGFVLPMAIARDTLVAFKPNGTRTVNVHSINLNSTVSFTLDDPTPPADAKWSAYVAGVAHSLLDENVPLVGTDLVIHSTVPIGGGLSSSASLEVATALAFLSAAQKNLDRKKLALVCQAAENKYVGMRCGIMDQYVSIFGARGTAVLVDCRSLAHQSIPLTADGAKFVVCDTTVRHNLAGSEYNKRRNECEQGVKIAREIFPNRDIKALRDLTVADLPELEPNLDPVVFKRVRHVVTEIARTLEAVNAMKAGNLVALGALMDASHTSLRDDYEVTCKELDTMVDIAWSLPGVFGSRMTGGGFGGCTITLVAAEHTDAFCKHIAALYQARVGAAPTIYVCTPEAGAEIIRTAD